MPPKYVIINDFDAPQPNMVCQWVEGVGYCYLDRTRLKPRYDGMVGTEASEVGAFGFCWEEKADGIVAFHRTDLGSVAVYRDGEYRRWCDSRDEFDHRQLTRADVKAKRSPRSPRHDR